MYSTGSFSQSDLRVDSFIYSANSYFQSQIRIIALLFQQTYINQPTIKQALLGNNFTESSTTIILNKADFDRVKSAEGLVAALMANLLRNNLNLSKMNLQYVQSNVANNKKNFYFWLQFYDYPLDLYNNPDITANINPNDF